MKDATHFIIVWLNVDRVENRLISKIANLGIDIYTIENICKKAKVIAIWKIKEKAKVLPQKEK
jgi:hypothetical protein